MARFFLFSAFILALVATATTATVKRGGAGVAAAAPVSSAGVRELRRQITREKRIAARRGGLVH